MLNGLGFRKEDWTRRTEEFSGGWQMRIALAKLLLEKPNLLLLDEPTNHLDLEARNWLEDYLHQLSVTPIVLISHDRYFLDVTVRKIVELWNKRVHFYTGNYEKYLAQKDGTQSATRSRVQESAGEDRATGSVHQSLPRAGDQSEAGTEPDQGARKDRAHRDPARRADDPLQFPQPKPSGRIVAEFQECLEELWREACLFGNANFVIERGDRVALVGVNGAGKSTLIKLLSGAEPLTSGEYKLGHNVEVDYFAQDQYKELDPNARMLDDLRHSARRARQQTELRTLLGCFLFSEDDVFKRIGVLSGGERNRYALAKMLLSPSNFLLLDEPTNHLDMRAKDVLLEALAEFTGTVVFVSHDRYFIDKLATRVFEIEDGEVHIFPGNYEDYLWRKSGKPLDIPAPVDAPVNGTSAPDGAGPGQAGQAHQSDEGAEAEGPLYCLGIPDRGPRSADRATRERTGRVQEYR